METKIEIILILNNNQTSIVKLVKIDNIEYVVKTYRKICRQFFIELNILATVKHQNVISLIKLLPPIDGGLMIGMMMPKENINLNDLLQYRRLSFNAKMDFLLQIAHGIQYLHENHIIHMDLKPDNIMVRIDPDSGYETIKIIDFSSAEYLFTNKLHCEYVRCTATHRAPEGFKEHANLNGYHHLDFKFDVWSFGIIVYEFFYGSPLYLHESVPKYESENNNYVTDFDDQMYDYIMSTKFRLSINQVVPIFILKKCLNYDPDSRPTMKEVIYQMKNCLACKKFRDRINPTKKSTNISMGPLDPPNLNNYDSNTKLDLQIVPITNRLNSFIEGYEYYCHILCQIAKTHSDKFRKYPPAILYGTFDLIHRLSNLLNWHMNDDSPRKSLDELQKNLPFVIKQYLNEAILICDMIAINQDIMPLEEIVYEPDPSHESVRDCVNSIIMMTNGVLFRTNLYDCNRPFAKDLKLMTSPKYLRIFNQVCLLAK